MIRKTTEELLELLKKNKLDTFIENNDDEFLSCTLSNYLNCLLEEKHLVKAEVIEKSGLFNIYAYQIFSGQKKPSRDKLISLCFGMALSVDETQTLLKYSGFAMLYPRNKRDSVIIYSLNNHISVINCNIKLDELGFSPL